MPNEFSLLADDERKDFYFIEADEKIIGEVSVVDGGWRYRIDNTQAWSSSVFGSEYEASEFVFVDRDMLQVNSNGVVVSHIKTKQ